jgi:hypothetical protein
VIAHLPLAREFDLQFSNHNFITIRTSVERCICCRRPALSESSGSSCVEFFGLRRFETLIFRRFHLTQTISPYAATKCRRISLFHLPHLYQLRPVACVSSRFTDRGSTDLAIHQPLAHSLGQAIDQDGTERLDGITHTSDISKE